jgi:hypothetical protein
VGTLVAEMFSRDIHLYLHMTGPGRGGGPDEGRAGRIARLEGGRAAVGHDEGRLGGHDGGRGGPDLYGARQERYRQWSHQDSNSWDEVSSPGRVDKISHVKWDNIVTFFTIIIFFLPKLLTVGNITDGVSNRGLDACKVIFDFANI